MLLQSYITSAFSFITKYKNTIFLATPSIPSFFSMQAVRLQCWVHTKECRFFTLPDWFDSIFAVTGGTENYFFSFLLIFCPENQFVILVRKPTENYKNSFQPIYVWHVESKLFFDLGLLFPWFSEIQKMILTVPKLSCKPRKL